MIQGLKQLTRGSAVSVVSVFLFLPLTASAGSNAEKIYRKVLPSVMTLEVENRLGEHFVGSGVVGLADDCVVTAWHVVSDARLVSAVFADGTRVKVKGCIDHNSERDLALLQLEKPLPGRKAVFSRGLQGVATRVYVIGAPKGYGFSIADGLLSQVRNVDGILQYQVSCPISPGNSGGPVLNERGEVIGIASWTKADAQNLSFAVPSREIGLLNNKAPLLAWDNLQLRLASKPPVPAATSGAAATAEAQDGKAGALTSFDEFTKRLQQSVGKQVTVVVQEGAKENKYTFTVPAMPAKGAK